MKRREFLKWVGVGTLASFLPVVIAACTTENKEQTSAQNSTPAPTTNGYLTIGTLTELDKNGQLLNKQTKDKPVMVIRNPQDSKTILAVNPTCSHKGCFVTWKIDEKHFECPCHDSDFTSDGKVLKGPATQPLSTYPVKIEGDLILVKTA
ncbi:ubiquinol-cytochrome c reductase iron-sulfur subunit [Ancylothrix sp. C2]|uniref:QcrA and Rieske domain-containing protein n=1 Tax=Ancylothrix sp. D3o TaxID=2953691 RepID=UPI0021BAD113|nr:ubiquinol-cytochrome c reductase iron-sulfur subunit [Ancylothrix sp. D3o]MCT7951152.1 ubiquinol-cytochrome c reductase iron-sulfur subunit [Ancylothrix sp. D3o]